MIARGEPLFCDANAGVPVLPEVLAEFVAVEQACPGNPASPHGLGRRARAALEQARERIAGALGVSVDEVVFTSGGTEACNLAVRGLGDPTLPVAAAPVEHPAVMEPALQRGLVGWSVDAEGAALVRQPERRVGALCLVHAQGEVGTLQPIEQALELGRQLHVPVFVDAAQTLGRVPVEPLLASGAVLALSPHKCGGLRGHGVLVGRAVAALRPLLVGGAQEHGHRPGTQSPALAAANALAIERALVEQPQRARQMAAIRELFLASLRSAAEASGNGNRVHLLTPMAASVPNTAMLCFEGLDGRSLLPALDLAGIAASRGSACSSGAPTPPHVLAAMGIEEVRAQAVVRFSFDWRSDLVHGRLAGELVAATLARLSKKI